jgi:hypothetical protein
MSSRARLPPGVVIQLDGHGAERLAMTFGRLSAEFKKSSFMPHAFSTSIDELPAKNS